MFFCLVVGAGFCSLRADVAAILFLPRRVRFSSCSVVSHTYGVAASKTLMHQRWNWSICVCFLSSFETKSYYVAHSGLNLAMKPTYVHFETPRCYYKFHLFSLICGTYILCMCMHTVCLSTCMFMWQNQKENHRTRWRELKKGEKWSR